jgi:hypothetical protein
MMMIDDNGIFVCDKTDSFDNDGSKINRTRGLNLAFYNRQILVYRDANLQLRLFNFCPSKRKRTKFVAPSLQANYTD